MKPQDVVPILERYGFQHLKLVKHEGQTSTFRFIDYNPANLKKSLGVPSIAGAGKVMVFDIPDVGRLGVSPTNSMVRFVASGTIVRPETDTSHLGKIKVPDVYIKALEKAKVDPTKRVAWMKKMWEWGNDHLFAHRLPPGTKFVTAPRIPGAKATTRGLYQGGYGWKAGTISLAGYLFNARNDFILEVFFHEMCHQAAWTVDQEYDTSGTGGHGPTWQKWMKHIGLDPRRYDPTDNIEYMSTEDARKAEAEITKNFGKRAPDAFFKHLKKAPRGYVGPAILNYLGRALPGEVTKDGTGLRFTSSSRHSWIYKPGDWPDNEALYIKEH